MMDIKRLQGNCLPAWLACLGGLGYNFEVMPKSPAAGSHQDHCIDETASTQAKWNVGDVVARSYAWLADVHYRKFLGITIDGGYLVQDFYEASALLKEPGTGEESKENVDGQELPFTSPYVLYSAQEMLNGNADIYQLRSVSGDYVSWYENGQKRQQVHFVQGKPHGMWEMWHANGSKRQEGLYQNGIPQGLWAEWYDNGNKLSEIEYVDGVKHGSHMEWFRHGHKCAQGQSEKGKPVGLWRWWDEEGHIIREVEQSA